MIVEEISERRTMPRVAIGNLVAEVDRGDGDGSIMVCIWDLSVGGACLMTPPDLKLPPKFDLLIDGLPHSVEKVWQRWCYVGVKILKAPAVAT